MSNEEIIKLIKAQILTTAGGQLSAKELDAFIDTCVEQSKFLGMARVERDIATTLNLDTLGVSSRIMVKGTEATEPSADEKAGVSIGRRSLTPIEAILPYDISFSFLRSNIEKEGAEAKINNVFARQFANDTVDLAFNGDTASANGCLKITDGYIKRAKADADAHTDTYVADDKIIDVLLAMLETLPSKWRGNLSELAFLMSPKNELKYRQELATRNTALGDIYLVKNDPIAFQGIKCEPIAQMPDTEIMLTMPINLAVGYGSELRVGKQLQERKRLVEYTLGTFVDANYVVSDQVVLFTQQ